MGENRRTLAGMSADEAAAHIMNNDISDLLAQAEIVREGRAARMVSAVSIELETQSALEAAAAARGICATTLMRLIIEEWVQTHSDVPADQISERFER
jgi:hypothetical protein